MAVAVPVTLEAGLSRLCDTVARLRAAQGGAQLLPSVTGIRNLPRRGVYFFVDPSEPPFLGHARIVRVGTHAVSAGSKSTLKQRLAQHRGKVSEAGGNHRGSIFRLLVGEALIEKGVVGACPSWGRNITRSAAAAASNVSPAALTTVEMPVEGSVSEYLSRLEVVYVAVDDEPGKKSARGAIERGAISLLAEGMRRGLIEAGENWLGRWSRRKTVRESGLWNQNHVGEPWSEDFLEVLALTSGT